MFQLYAVDRAGMGAFIRDFVRAFSSARPAQAFEMSAFDSGRPGEPAGAARVAEPSRAEPAPELRTLRGPRLIDLERRAKFARFDATR